MLTLERPAVHNAVDEATVDALEAHLDQLDADPGTTVVLLTGAGDRTFCSGGDLKWFKELDTGHAGARMSRRMRSITSRLADGQRPLVVCANGHALGGGMELLLCGHVRVGASTARFGFRQASMGVVTGWGGGVRSIRTLGLDKARALWLTGEELDAQRALQWGVLHMVADPNAVRGRALAIAEEMASQSPEAIRRFLRLARVFQRDGADAAADDEFRSFSELWTGPWFRAKLERPDKP